MDDTKNIVSIVPDMYGTAEPLNKYEVTYSNGDVVTHMANGFEIFPGINMIFLVNDDPNNPENSIMQKGIGIDKVHMIELVVEK